MKKTQKFYFFSYILLYTVFLSLLFILPFKPILSYTFIYIASSVIFIIICRQILKSDISANYIFGLIALALIIRIAFIPVHPIGSDDYYRYVWDGKVQAYGINPYEYAPNNAALDALHTKILPKLINFPKIKTIYPPLSEILFYLSYLIGGESFIGIKILLFIFDLFTLLGLYLLIKQRNLPNKNILIYALSPLILFQFFVDAHLDGLGLPFLIFSIFFYLNDQKIWSYLLLGLSLCIKPLGLILIPIYFVSERELFDRLKSLTIPLLVVGLFYLPYIFTGSPFQALINFTENWTFNGIVFNIFDLFIKDNQRTRLLCGILLLSFYIPIIFSKRDILLKIYLSVFILFIFSPIVHPWYVTWLALLLPLIPRWSGIVYTSLISLAAFTELNYQISGVWKESALVQIIEYAPVIILFIYELIRYKKDENNKIAVK